jgi:hypothetical protein
VLLRYEILIRQHWFELGICVCAVDTVNGCEENEVWRVVQLWPRGESMFFVTNRRRVCCLKGFKISNLIASTLGGLQAKHKLSLIH